MGGGEETKPIKANFKSPHTQFKGNTISVFSTATAADDKRSSEEKGVKDAGNPV